MGENANEEQREMQVDCAFHKQFAPIDEHILQSAVGEIGVLAADCMQPQSQWMSTQQYSVNV